MDTSIIATVVAVVGLVVLLAYRLRIVQLMHRFDVVASSKDTMRERSRALGQELSHNKLPPVKIDSLELKAESLRRFWVQVFITAAVLLASLYVLVLKPDAETSLKDFCYTAVGTLLGFWLKA